MVARLLGTPHSHPLAGWQDPYFPVLRVVFKIYSSLVVCSWLMRFMSVAETVCENHRSASLLMTFTLLV